MNVIVSGKGKLASAIRVAMKPTMENGALGTQIEVAVADTWSVPTVRATFTRLTVHAELGEVRIGPIEEPRRPGCPECAERRRSRVDPRQRDIERVRHERRGSLETTASAWLTQPAIASVAALAYDEVHQVLRGGRPLTYDSVLILHLDDSTVTRHRYLPDPRCPQCGELPADEPVVFDFGGSLPKLSPDKYRIRKMADELDHLKELYVDPVYGVIPSIDRRNMGGLVVASAPIVLPDGAVETGFGRVDNYRKAEAIAILEALERRGGAQPGGRATTVTARFRDLENALDPRQLGVHPIESYRRPGFAFREFSPDAVCRWVWGYSLTQCQPILVPESLAYYRLPHRPAAERGFLYEISNGCALGGSLVEAIIFGVLEVIERDGFLMTWYAQLPAARIKLDSAREEAMIVALSIEATTGFDVMVFDTTMEHGISSVWALAVNPVDEWPKMTCAGASGLNMDDAVLSGLNELAPVVENLKNSDFGDRATASSMALDPYRVVTMAHHLALYAHPDAFPRLSFLTEAPTVEVSPPDIAFQNADLSRDLDELVARLREVGLEVVVVDQTSSEHRAAELHCVKVLIPGMVPMTFGHVNRRIDGLSRLLRARRNCGLVTRDVPQDSLNPHPHPFP